MTGLDGSVALVTGGGSGIGLATARALGLDGARLVLVGLPDSPLADAVGQLRAAGIEAVTVAADVSSAADAERAIHVAVETYGALDVLVNCAGTSSVSDVAAMEEAEWDRVFDTNVKGVFLMARAAIPALIASGRGSIVNVASQLALSAVPGFSAYCASKAAVVHLTRCLALELLPSNVRVNCVCPGGRGPQGTLADLVAAHPIGRLGEPEEIAAAIRFLVSAEASFVVGAALVADGGYTLA
jgi:meso-butanediol dehydrogenase / (S,S)-butanediol dehydrogenase / diacetyl reductase